ncbi:hypothetical protein F3Y22_tig00110785pilonHSYRG00186 [Hibiscus syriacus]|uniref:NAC domain-containing protein n=1 Tax=Hibiscus syriacus TaxID=106335 RepID=A0A6A2ZRZ1_HIBSY|nr:hypothetical protein F3Y22_tig00110785pilonHSYRG00186 [Hibiscus syriacus]
MAVISLNSLLIGIRFRPTDEELIDCYLRKATGKDRKIKSGSSLIGMKKTLVSYTGRAPMGKRTNWVMHEYRTTLDELDGTKAGQNPFVICRLFKKQDETIEDINGNYVDSGSSSHTEDVQSEFDVPRDKPTVEVKSDKVPYNSETCLEGLDNKMMYHLGATGSVTLFSVAFADRSIALDVRSCRERFQWGGVRTPNPMAFGMDGGSYCESDADMVRVMVSGRIKLLTYCLSDVPTATAFAVEHHRVPLEVKATAHDIKLSGDGAFYNVLNSNGGSSNHVNATYKIDTEPITGIKIRSCTCRSQPNIENLVTQGTASRRFKLQVHPRSEEKEDDSKPIVTKGVQTVEDEITVGDNAAPGTTTMDEPEEISISELSRNNVSRLKTKISVHERGSASMVKEVFSSSAAEVI